MSELIAKFMSNVTQYIGQTNNYASTPKLEIVDEKNIDNYHNIEMIIVEQNPYYFINFIQKENMIVKFKENIEKIFRDSYPEIQYIIRIYKEHDHIFIVLNFKLNIIQKEENTDDDKKLNDLIEYEIKRRTDIDKEYVMTDKHKKEIEMLVDESEKSLEYKDDHIERLETGFTKIDLEVCILGDMIDFAADIENGYTSNADWGEISYTLCGYNTKKEKNKKKIKEDIRKILVDENLTEINEDTVLYMITTLIEEADDEIGKQHILENMDSNTLHLLGY